MNTAQRAPGWLTRSAVGSIALAVLAVASCSTSDGEDPGKPPAGAAPGTSSAGTSSPDATAEPQGAVIRRLPQSQWSAMVDAGMVREGCPVTERSQLRRVDLDYVDFDGDLQRGHLVVREDAAEAAARIFERLFEAEFPIRGMQGVEQYGGDTLRSLQADNTSAYNCRRLDQINAPVLESPHANGRAIDINPRENPWMDLRCDCWSPGAKYAKRTPGPGKIVRSGLVWQTFVDEGWIWQNIPVADYMHFDTGYPSVAYSRPGS